MLLILVMGFGFGAFDRFAVGYIAHYIVQGLKISNTQLGMLGSALSLTYAIAGFVIGRWSDAAGVRKPFLIGILAVFSIGSILSGLAASFKMLLASRLIMGIAEGPLGPICLAFIAVESSPRRRGLNIGLLFIGGALIGHVIAPIVLVPLAEGFSWRVAFFLAGIPGLLCAIAVMLWLREPPPAPSPERRAAGHAMHGAASIFVKERNTWLCLGIACLTISWQMLMQSFLPIFLTTIRGLTGKQMSRVMGVAGIAIMTAGFLGPAISDRIGRKPVTIASCLLCALLPLSALYFHGPAWALATLMFIGWTGMAIASQMALVAGESLPVRYTATAWGLIVGAGEVVGGFGAPLIGGWAADRTTLAAPIKLAAAGALSATILALFLRETAPVKVGVAFMGVDGQDRASEARP